MWCAMGDRGRKDFRAVVTVEPVSRAAQTDRIPGEERERARVAGKKPSRKRGGRERRRHATARKKGDGQKAPFTTLCFRRTKAAFQPKEGKQKIDPCDLQGKGGRRKKGERVCHGQRSQKKNNLIID